MKKAHKTVHSVGLCVLFCLAMALSALGVTATNKTLKASPLTTEELGGAERYLAHVTTDKPIYRGGEILYGRCVVLHSANHKPLSTAAKVMFQVIGPKGDIVSCGYAETEESVGGFMWDIPEGIAGGEYVLKVTHPGLGIPPAERKFDIRDFRAPRLRTQIKFIRDGYGPGERVGATLEVKRAEGGFPENAKVTVTARVDGHEIHKSMAIIDRAGNCQANFALPRRIARGEGTLVFTIEDGGVVETASKTIPILLQTVDVGVYPESGELVANMPCRVYIEARTPALKPADIAGVVVDSKGRQVATFRTEHEGRGRFVMIPKRNGQYSLKITEPAGIKTTYPLPPVKTAGAVIQSLEDVYARNQTVELRVISTVKGPLTLTLRKQEEEVASLSIKGSSEAGKGVTADVILTPAASADGVLIATVWDADGHPLAERLIYREPAQSLTVEITPDLKRYVPGGKAHLNIRTIDENGHPAGAVVGVTVTDDSVLEMIERREQAPRLPVMVLLENDVQELADAHVYLDKSNPKAPVALDLLLGSQGWRRFAFINVQPFLDAYGDAARRVLAEKMVVHHKNDRLNLMPAAAIMQAIDAVEEEGKGGDLPRSGKPREGARDLRNVRKEAGVRGMVAKAQVKKESKLKSLVGFAWDADRKDEAARASEESIAYVPVRIYAHVARPDRKPGDRVDFTETLYWCAGVKTDAKTGEARIDFDLNDSVSSFKICADAFTASGSLGSQVQTIESVQPFYVEPKLPLEVTMGDRIDLPVSFINGTVDAFPQVSCQMMAMRGIKTGMPVSFAVGAGERVRRIVALDVGNIATNVEFAFEANAGAYSDRIVRKFRVVPRGFPVEICRSGMLQANSTVKLTFDIPASRVAGSVASSIAIYPTPLANLTEALERLIQEPYGCFEQTTSTTYPLVMAQQYFLSHQGVDPKLVERSNELLEKGYKRLIGFECKQKGYEWFGSDPGHEALTAFGLLEFIDMSRVYGVDSDMLSRTKDWLLGTKDGEGGFRRERRALHTWSVDPDCSNTYITWALLEAGEPVSSLQAEIKAACKAALNSKNSYVMALGANVAAMAGDQSAAKNLMDKLVRLQMADGSVDGGTTTIVASGGEALKIETTALTLLAWLKDPAYAGQVEKGIRWMAESCKSGRYGSTQSTVLALRAIISYDKARSKPKAAGSFQLRIDGRQAGSEVKFDENTHGAILLPDVLTEMLEPGTHTVELTMNNGAEMPYAVTVKYSDEQPASSQECPVGLTVALAETRIAEGKVTEAQVTVVNRRDKAVPTPIAIIGIPGGLEVRHDQLKELVKSGKIAAYEVLGREVVLYWRLLDANQKVELPLSLVAAIPGFYTGPASRAYLYYTDEHKEWVNPLRVTIVAR